MRSFLKMTRYYIVPVLTLFSTNLFAQDRDSKQILSTYLSRNSSTLKLQSQDYAELFVTSDVNDHSTGVRHVYAQQRFNNIDVAGGMFSLHTSSGKEYATDNLIRTSVYRVDANIPWITPDLAARTAFMEEH